MTVGELILSNSSLDTGTVLELLQNPETLIVIKNVAVKDNIEFKVSDCEIKFIVNFDLITFKITSK